MNLKKAKLLRKMANRMALDAELHRGTKIVQRHLVVHPAHEKKAKEEGFRHVTAVNSPTSVRGIYRWLKRHAA